MKRLFSLTAAVCVSTACIMNVPAQAQDTNPLFTQEKVQNFLPHMTWPEVEELLTRTDVALIPVGSIEQHGRHLPLGTDSYAATELCKLVAQRADALVAPVVLAGLSAHHLGFPGSLTLSAATFEQVIFETAEALIHHGIRKIALYNGHGGNRASVTNVITRINNWTAATAVDLGQIDVSMGDSPYGAVEHDSHAGVGETSWMLFLTPQLVQMAAAENPVLTFPPDAQKARETMSGAALDMLLNAYMWRPEAAGKQAATHQMTSNGVFTMGDVHTASAAQGRFRFERLVEAAAQFINDWNGKR
jgi:creatinine amidohydrolase